GEAERPEHACEAAQRPGKDEEPELDPPDADAGEEGGLLTGPDREHRPSEWRRMEDDAEDNRERGEEGDGVRDVRVRDRDDADAREVCGEAADRVGRQDSLRDASVERERSDR